MEGCPELLATQIPGREPLPVPSPLSGPSPISWALSARLWRLLISPAAVLPCPSFPTLLSPVLSPPPTSVVPIERHLGLGSARGALLGCVQNFAAPWTAVFQAPLSMGFPRQEHWGGLPPPGYLPDPGIGPTSPVSPAWQGGLFTAPPGKLIPSFVHSFLVGWLNRGC